MKVIYLVGGKGTRLAAINQGLPKSLVPIRDKSLLARNVLAFSKNALEPIFATGFKAELFEDFDYKTVFNEEFDTTNMVWTLIQALEIIRPSESVCICYGDIAISPSAISQIVEKKGDIVVAYDSKWKDYWQYRFNHPVDDAESFIIDVDSLIHDIGNPITSLNEPQGQFVGFFKFSGAVIEYILEMKESFDLRELKAMYTTELFMNLRGAGYDLTGVDIGDSWLEIDIPKDIEAALVSGRLGRIDSALDF